ncbi:uncharacterized protein LOC128550109 isoform X2 [Mercenaria mercenaria]|uniref:uncharacterized protein LOC128550109 isoform X2 n=1 Tax=Mercenaria mercenaria TaxID=6596 RepID=UPI00234EA253|nr:uncharacterized protein LOC128550109 isoform X2 [Mercenaria mercenaria]
MSLCDHIHEMSPDTNIYLCEILPRELDCSYNKYTGLKTGRDLSQVRSWIESINRAVEEVCHYIPYLQYHVYTKHFHGKEHLRRDGLHLNSEGGEMCWRSIKLDILNDMDTPTQGTTGFILGDEQWPPLNSREKEFNIEEISEGLPALYSDVVQSVLENTHQIIETVTVSSTSQPTQNLTEKQRIYNRSHPRPRRKYHRRRPKWMHKMNYIKKEFPKRPADDKNFVNIEVGSGVVVAVPSCKVNGFFRDRTVVAVETEFCRLGHKSVLPENVETKRRKVVSWLYCPDCAVKCSREDFLLDHIIVQHCRTAIKGGAAYTKKPKNSRHKHSKTFNNQKVSDVESSTVSKQKGYSNRYIEKEIPSCEGMFSVFSPSEWRDLLQLMTLSYLCTSEGMNHVILNMLIIRNVDLSQIKLLLSGDVELNPGPDYICQWEDCTFASSTVGALDQHIVTHAARSNGLCCWGDCAFNKPDGSVQDLARHVLQHLYNDKNIFVSIEDWYAVIPGGTLNATTDLNSCPQHLRSQLKLLLFDEVFKITSDSYTVDQHLRYLDFERVHYPTNFGIKRDEFIRKRTELGEHWDNYLGQEEMQVPPVTSKTHKAESVPRPFYTVYSDKKYHVVTTDRPEFASNLAHSVKLKSDRKRKCEVSEPLSDTEYFMNDSWFGNLLHNLSLCKVAMNLQSQILQKLKECNFLSPNTQHVFALEREAYKLGSLENCSAGTFVYTVFKCDIGNRSIYYIRYIETGIYIGIMEQKYLNRLRESLQFSDENVLLHNVLTVEDLTKNQEELKRANDLKRKRPDKIFKHSVNKIIPQKIEELKDTEMMSDISLESFLVHCLPNKSKSSINNMEDQFIEAENYQEKSEEIKDCLLDFRMNRLDVSAKCSKDILEKTSNSVNNLFEQSKILNFLSGDIKAKPELFKGTSRFESNFLDNSHVVTSLRNKTCHLYLNKNLMELKKFYAKWFPELCEELNIPDQTVDIPINQPVTKRLKKSNNIRPLQIRRKTLEEKVPVSVQFRKPGNHTIYESFCLALIERGKLIIQSINDCGIVACMNDYSDIDGSFKENNFVYTTKISQETGEYFYCSCSIYRTLINCDETESNGDEFHVIDLEDESVITCMHCKFLKNSVIPCIVNGEELVETNLSKFIKNALSFKGKDIVELIRGKETRKFSVLTGDDDYPTFVHLTYKKQVKRYIASCLNGYCKALKGHKRNIEYLSSAEVCKHLSVLKSNKDCWEDILDFESLLTNDIPKSDSVVEEEDELWINTDVLDANFKGNFDVNTGLWNFECRSDHPPSKRDSELLQSNLICRDGWNDRTLTRLDDGCLKGPILCPDIPENTCECGSGWLKREDDDEYSELGLTEIEKSPKSRILTIYTQLAPVKCEVHTRVCYNKESPCKIMWNEGELDSLHVLSRETAAGDEIGWEFVSMVMNSGCTFASFCKYKTENYKIRHGNAKFMSPTLFIRWWFSWAANMKIEFRVPCKSCGFKPRRLCCDGTRVGVGFRHASYEEINKTDEGAPVNETLHRRMDRCFLKNMKELEKQEVIQFRSTLDYLARRVIQGVKDDEVIPDVELEERVNSLNDILPDEISPSFSRFIAMADHDNEKLAYAFVLKMLATTASITSLLPPPFCGRLQQFLNNPTVENTEYNFIMSEMRTYAPEIRDLIHAALRKNNSMLPHDLRLFLQYIVNESLSLKVTEPEPAVPQADTYNPEKFGRAYYFNEYGMKLRNVRKFSIDTDRTVRNNVDHDDETMDFDRCHKLFSKTQTSARGTSNLFLWFCADHGHCYGFHMTGAEGRKDPAASLYSYLEKPPHDIFYDFACNLQEYCLNRESGYYKDVRFFHDIFHGYSHKCSCAFRSSRLQGFETVNSEICEQFNSFIQCIKKSARQMSQSHFCFYLHFFLHPWNEKGHHIKSKEKLVNTVEATFMTIS